MRATRLEVLALAAALLGSACDAARSVEGTTGAEHPSPWVDQHASAALASLDSCRTCHGADFSGGTASVSCTDCHARVGAGYPDWQTNCTFCHGTRTPGFTLTPASLALVAPPNGAHGETDPTQPAVGAHDAHLKGLTRSGTALAGAVACTECHAIPADLSHVDGGVATLTFGALATQGGLQPSYAGGSCSATYCHGATLAGGANTAPTWTGTVSCGDCHGTPPATGRHGTVSHVGMSCDRCHAAVADSATPPGILDTPEARALHVNGVNDVAFKVSGTWDAATRTCSNVACHTQAPADRIW